MKKIFLFLLVLIVLNFGGLFANVEIGSGLELTNKVPLSPFYGYSYVQSIFPQELIQGSGDITAIKFHYSITSSDLFDDTDSLVVFMGHTALTSFSGNDSWVPVGELTEVFNGTWTIDNFDNGLPGEGWVTLELDTPFNYNNTDNLVIGVDENKSGYSASSDKFFGTEYAEDITIGYRSDNTNPDPAFPENASYGYPSNLAADVILVGIDSAAMPSIPSQPTPEDAATDVEVYVNFNWNSYFATSYDLYLGTDLIADDIDVTNFAYTTQLDYSTNYSWHVVASNTQGSVDGPEWTFTTRIDPTIVPPVFYNFTDSYKPLDWIEAKGLLGETVELTGTSSGWTNDGWLNDGSTGAVKNNIYGTSRKDWLITSPINLGDGSTHYQMMFDMALTDYGNANVPEEIGDDDKFAVLISTDNGLTWSSDNALQIWSSTTTPTFGEIFHTGQTVNFDLTAYTGIVKFAFYAESTVSNADNDFFIDNLNIMEMSDNPLYHANTDSINCGLVAVDGQSEDTNVVIENLGGGILNIQSVVIDGAEAGHFGLTDSNTYPYAIDSEGNLTFGVHLAPTVEGTFQANVVITDDLGRDVNSIIVAGSSYLSDGNDTPATATVLTIPVDSLEAEISPINEIDFYKFQLVENQVISAYTNRLGESAIDPEAYLYGACQEDGSDVSDSTLVETNDDGNGNLQPLIDYTATEAGWYFLRIAHFSDDPTRADTGEYVLYIEDLTPSTGTLEGTITDSVSNAPIADATITAGTFTATTDATGNYQMEVNAETYTVSCSATGYVTKTVADIAVLAGQTSTVDFALVEEVIILDTPSNVNVDAETGTISWNAPSESISLLLVDDDGSAYIDFTDTQANYTAVFDAMDIDYTIIDIVDDAGDGPDAATMSAYDVVIWECGEQWALGRTLTANDETNLGTYIDGGGHLILSSHDYMWDAYSSAGSFSAGQFPYDYLGVASVNQDIYVIGESQGGPAADDLIGATGSYVEGLTVQITDIFSTGRDGVYIDDLTPAANGAVYATCNGYNAGIQTANTIFTTAGFAGLVDGANTVQEWFNASINGFSMSTRDLTGYEIYLDNAAVTTVAADVYQYTFTGLINGQSYVAGVAAIHDNGTSDVVDATFTYSGTGSDDLIPETTKLFGNYPNPFNPITHIRFQISNSTPVVLDIYNIRGEKIKALVNETLSPQSYDYIWDGTDNNNNSVGSGVYFYKMKTDKFTSTKKMILMK